MQAVEAFPSSHGRGMHEYGPVMDLAGRIPFMRYAGRYPYGTPGIAGKVALLDAEYRTSRTGVEDLAEVLMAVQVAPEAAFHSHAEGIEKALLIDEAYPFPPWAPVMPPQHIFLGTSRLSVLRHSLPFSHEKKSFFTSNTCSNSA
jgi:hypothetical protein